MCIRDRLQVAPIVFYPAAQGMTMTTLTETHIEFHILQSFPVSCLNRDDVGAPKSAMIGGVSRARVSSQCWKRHVRLALQDLGVKIGVRTKQVAGMLAEACETKGATPEQAKAFGEACAPLLAEDTLYFFSKNEAEAIAEFAAAQAFEPESAAVKKSGKTVLSPELRKAHKAHFNPAVDGLDIALFGRMVAQAPDLNVHAAASFAHAVSTHRVDNEIEFFTALDDLKSDDETGSAHMGSLEYNSATYYRYINLDLGQLADSLGNTGLADAVSAFIKALYIAVPSARQTTQTGMRPWDYARIYIRRGQGLSLIHIFPGADENVLKLDRTVTLHSDKTQDEALEEALLRSEGGQQILWIENTVAEAQAIYKGLAARASGMDVEVGLLHSRFTPADRCLLYTSRCV